MLDVIPVTNCFRCDNPLTLKESRVGVYCSPCAKVRADEKHRQELADKIHKANNRVKP